MSKGSPTAQFFRKALPACNVCGLAITGHEFGEVAVTAIPDENAVSAKALLDAVTACDWNVISAKQDFNGILAAVIVYMLKCPDHRQSLVAMLDGPDLYDNFQMLKQQLIPNSEESSMCANWETL